MINCSITSPQSAERQEEIKRGVGKKAAFECGFLLFIHWRGLRENVLVSAVSLLIKDRCKNGFYCHFIEKHCGSIIIDSFYEHYRLFRKNLHFDDSPSL